jgi:branched-chain amino acid transport system permease protein
MQQLLLNGIVAGAIYGLVAIGFTVIYRTVRFFHFAHGVVYATGAYVAYAVASHWLSAAGGQSSIAGWCCAVLAGVAGAGILGGSINRLVYLPLRNRNAPNLVFLIASFGVFIFIQNLLQLIFGAEILTLRTGPVRAGHHVFGAVITNTQVLIVVTSVILSVGLWTWVRMTKLGKAIQAVASDPMLASISGIAPETTILVVFAIGSALAGAAGILVSLETNIEPTMGMDAILKGIIASIIGGIGSIPGAMLGGLFLGIVENLAVWRISAGWKDGIAFLVLIVFLLFKPGGIVGVRLRRQQI